LQGVRRDLEQAGFEVAVVRSAADGLRAVRARAPHAVVANALAADPDGFTLCRELRRDPALAGLPVTLLSTWRPTLDDRERARRPPRAPPAAPRRGRWWRRCSRPRARRARR